MEVFELIQNGFDISKLSQEQMDLLPMALTPPESKEELWFYVKVFFGVEIPRTKVCPDCSAPLDALWAAYTMEDPTIIWHAARGSGKTAMITILAMTLQVTQGIAINILGGSQEQSEIVLNYIHGKDPNCSSILWNNFRAPEYLKNTAKDTNKHKSLLFTGGLITALTASDKSVRGKHPCRITADELDSTEFSVVESALGQPATFTKNVIHPDTGEEHKRIVKKGCLFSSTWQRPDGSMTKMMERARARDWPIFRWCYKEVVQPYGWMNPQDIEDARNTLGERMFELEYDCREPRSEGTTWTPEQIDLVFGIVPDKEGKFYPIHHERINGFPRKWEGKPGKVVHLLDPSEGITFYHGADWAKSKDSTILNTFARNPQAGEPDIMVHWERWEKMPWDVVVAKYNKIVSAYKGASCHDSTGIGSVINDMLTHPSTAIQFSDRKLINDIFSAYAVAIERGEVRLPYIEFLYKEHKFCTDDMLYGKDHVPDVIVAAALAWHVRTKAEFSLKMFRPSTNW